MCRQQAHGQGLSHDSKGTRRQGHRPVFTLGKRQQKGSAVLCRCRLHRQKIVEKLLEANMPPLICEKGRKGVPLTADQKQSNKMISSVRSRIEHAFGFIEESLGGSVVRSIGLIRAKFNITLTSLVYNICRLGQIVRGGVRRIGVSESLHRC